MNHAPSSANSLETEGKPSDGGTVAAWKFRLLAARHYKDVYRMACSLLRDGHEAEDVVQEVFMRFWQQGANVEKPRNWLMRVAHNLSIDRLRIAGRFVEVDEEALTDDSGGDSDPEWNYRQGELSARLERAIDTLPGIQRSLVVLYDMRGMSGKDCAEILGISVNQVKVYLHRARRRLREKLERPDG